MLHNDANVDVPQKHSKRKELCAIPHSVPGSKLIFTTFRPSLAYLV
jgi:hypothetical protein